jgi:hypothetical protein
MRERGIGRGGNSLSRRQLLQLGALLPIGAIIAACEGKSRQDTVAGAISDSGDEDENAVPTATSTSEPFIIPAGEEQGLLMKGTPQETPLYIFGTGVLGPIVAVLGGVHGNEPGGWLAADRLIEEMRPQTGGLLVVPRANAVAVNLFERTTAELGDLNRLYPGRLDGLPMERMAYEIVDTLRQFHVSLLIDMHESWAFYRDRTDTQTGTAFLGQTISSRGEPGETLARALADTMNSRRIQSPVEEFTFREWPPRGFALPTGTPDVSASSTPEPSTTGPDASFGGSRSSLGLPNYITGLAAILVEMGQQQSTERRVDLHIEIVKEAVLRMAGA